MKSFEFVIFNTLFSWFSFDPPADLTFLNFLKISIFHLIEISHVCRLRTVHRCIEEVAVVEFYILFSCKLGRGPSL